MSDHSEGTIESHDAIPAMLTAKDQWVCWRYEEREDGDGEPYQTKVPYNAETGNRAKPDTPDTWTTYEQARDCHREHNERLDGIGYMFSEDGPFAGIDLDNAYDPATDEWEPWARDCIDRADSYTEFSPSGTGGHAWGCGAKPSDDRSKTSMPSTLDAYDDAEIEIYDCDRFFTITGHHVEDTPTAINHRSDELTAIYESVFESDGGEPEIDTDEIHETVRDELSEINDEGESESVDLSDSEVVEKAKNAKHGDKFARLWDGGTNDFDSHSEAVLSLLDRLAFWTGKDRQQMDRLFRSSGLYVGKWKDEKWERRGDDEIDAAVSAVSDTYSGNGVVNPEQTATEALETAKATLDTADGWGDENAAIDAFVESLADARMAGFAPANASSMCRSLATDSDAFTKTDISDKLSSELDSRRDDEDDAQQITWARAQAEYGPAEECDHDLGRHYAVELIEEDHTFATHRDSEHVYQYDDERGVFDRGGETYIRELVSDGLEHRAKQSRDRNIINEIQNRTFEDTDDLGGPAGTLCVNNGVFDLATREMSDHAPDYLFLRDLDVAYDKAADCPQWCSFIEEMVPESDRDKLQEYAGYCLHHWDQPYKKALFIQGPQDSGKSTFLSVLTAILGGQDNVASETLHSLIETRWGTAQLFGKYANIHNDIDATDLKQPGRFKVLTGNDKSIPAERKNEKKFTFKPSQKLVFAANRYPHVKNADDVFHNRWIHVSFPNRVATDEQDEGLRDDLLDEAPGILNWMLEGYDRLRDQGQFSDERTAEDKRELWEGFGDSISRFKTQELVVTGKQHDWVPVDEVYSRYQKLCAELEMAEETKTAVTQRLTDDERVEKTRKAIDGNRQYVYRGVTGTDW
jgi:putative DNA primase/helicase